MINLDGVQPFAEGGNRRCYVHPENNYRCLKVTIQDQSKIAKENAPWYKKFRSESTFDDNIREQKAYAQRALKKDNPETRLSRKIKTRKRRGRQKKIYIRRKRKTREWIYAKYIK